MRRREMMAGLLAISAAAGGLAACGKKAVEDGGGKDLLAFASPGKFFSQKEMAFLTSLAGVIIPATDTPGAIEAGVPETLQSLLSEWAEDDMRAGWRTAFSELQDQLSVLGGGSFLNLPSAQKADAVAKLDAAAFGADYDKQGRYRDIKSTIATAYYMSEPGATQELAYEAVPGDWKGCVPLSEYPKTWAT